jgi:peptidoglycan/LPS O-acetylase OafA/YrhL
VPGEVEPGWPLILGANPILPIIARHIIYLLLVTLSPFSPSPFVRWWGILGGLLLAGVALLTERRMKRVPLRNLLGSFIGLILGIVVANFISNALFPNFFDNQQMILPLYGLIYGICGYIGVRIGFKKGDE